MPRVCVFVYKSFLSFPPSLLINVLSLSLSLNGFCPVCLLLLFVLTLNKVIKTDSPEPKSGGGGSTISSILKSQNKWDAMEMYPPPTMFTPPASSTSSMSISLASLPASGIRQTGSNLIYFSSTTSEPAQASNSGGGGGGGGSTFPGSHYIRRAPDAIRHLGGSAERFCLPKPRIYRVLYPYKPQQVDELELQYGDLLTVTIQCDDGWFLGRSTLSGKFGTFPGNYVEPV